MRISDWSSDVCSSDLKGQLLFTIDPRPFNAALAEARADAASARSKLALTRTNFARAERLIVDDAISQSDVDQLSAEVRAATAALAAAEARDRKSTRLNSSH